MGGEEEGRDQDPKIFWPRIAPGCGRVLPWLLTSASCANTDELIELPLWALTRAGPVEPRIRLDPDPTREGHLADGVISGHAVDILEFICQKVAAMRPLATITTANCCCCGRDDDTESWYL